MSPGLSLTGRVCVDWLTAWFLGQIADQNNPLGLAALLGSSALEYVFPPFPGDTITLLGAILITGYGWSFTLVFGAVMVGSLAGTMVAYGAGSLWQRRRLRRMGESRAAVEKGILDELVARFRRHGAIYLVLNRFLPGVRTFFFIAAGLAEIRAHKVLFWSAISATLWNLGLVAVGALVGAKLDALERVVRTYSVAAWAVVGVGVIAIIVFWWRRRRPR